MDIFDKKQIRPMLLTRNGKPFDSEDFVFELKFDGARMLAYLDVNGTHLENRNLNVVNYIFPEFNFLHKTVNEKCILDGEIVFIDENGRPDFRGFQARNHAKNAAAKMREFPMTYAVFDILYLKDREVVGLPLTERKALLEKTVSQTENFSLVRSVEKNGIELFNLTKELNFEGIVAKRKDSVYQIGKRTENWIKIKHLQTDEFLICGYILKEGKIKDLILCSENESGFKDEGFVYLGMNKPEEKTVLKFAKDNVLKSPLFAGREPEIVWIKPELTCAVEYLNKTSGGARRHAVFKNLT